MEEHATIALNAPKGLGDAIYLRAVMLHLKQRGRSVRVFTAWPEVFDDLDVETVPSSKMSPQDDLSHVTACLHCRVPLIEKLTQFRLACLQAGLIDAIDLRIDWNVRSPSLVDGVMKDADGRKILLYQPVKRANNADQELLRPRREAFNRFVRERRGCFRIKIGHPHFVEPDLDAECELDLTGQTSVQDVFDIATHQRCDVFGAVFPGHSGTGVGQASDMHVRPRWTYVESQTRERRSARAHLSQDSFGDRSV